MLGPQQLEFVDLLSRVVGRTSVRRLHATCITCRYVC